MIVVTVALLSAITKDTTRLGVLKICNDGTGDMKRRHYNGEVLRKPDFGQVTRKGRLESHNAQALTIWHLVARMLKGMGYAGKGDGSDIVDEDACMEAARREADPIAFIAGARWQAAQMIKGDDV